ncbi:anti-sigma factor [Streptomyces sp. AC627_RSS907]|uniref:anti-sigma factor family protein n=1 Tax=Streptomyces sp. AC627_RSS907 TaxID=2823684 RepID=UPI001C23BC50|nr:zf-HC2 domain-containing protein [Streptomyces sp. AC627_RSS907]
MTSSTTDMAGHPDTAEISDLAEDLLPTTRAAAVRRHLETCAPCADVYASLEEIQGLLGTLPVPARMPDDVADRIDAALAAETRPSATTPDFAGPAAATARLATSGSNDSTHVSRETTASTDRPAGHARPSSAGPGRKDRRRIGRRRIAALGAVAAATLGLGSVIVSSMTGGSPSDDTARGKQSALADTFSAGQLKEKVTGLIADGQEAQDGTRTPRSFGMESDGGAETGAENRVFKKPTVPECIQKGIGRSDAALATEKGVYQGKKALLVVLPDASNDSLVTAYIVEATCVDEPAVSKAEILLKHSYARS